MYNFRAFLTEAKLAGPYHTPQRPFMAKLVPCSHLPLRSIGAYSTPSVHRASMFGKPEGTVRNIEAI